jgi:prevent-host-death family protein
MIEASLDEVYALTYSSLMTTRVVPKTDLRERIREELDSLGEDTLLVTDRGRPLAVAVSVGRWNQLQELIEDLEDRVAILEHRSTKDRGRRIASVLASIEDEEADVRRSHRKTS